MPRGAAAACDRFPRFATWPTIVDLQRYHRRARMEWRLHGASGTFTLDAYDTSFNLTTHIVGVLNGTRITMATTANDLM
jgi:hypothetical protein